MVIMTKISVGIIMIMHNDVIRVTMISGGIIRIIDHMTIYFLSE